MDENMIGVLLKKLSNQFSRFMAHHKDRIASIAECGNQLTGMQLWIINFINRQDCDVLQKDIEKFFNIRRATATNILQLMEKNGLILREVCQSDARQKLIFLTDKAVSVHNRIDHEVGILEGKLTRGLTDIELDFLRVVIDKIYKNLAAENSELKTKK